MSADSQRLHNAGVARRWLDWQAEKLPAHMLLFLKPNHRDPLDLGFTIQLHVDLLPNQCTAASFLYHLLYYSENAKALANEMLKECLQTDKVREIGESSISVLKTSLTVYQLGRFTRSLYTNFLMLSIGSLE